MDMTSVDSSFIASIGYKDGTLHILFSSGKLYSYSNVPESVYIDFMNAPSHGKYFHAYINSAYVGYKMN